MKKFYPGDVVVNNSGVSRVVDLSNLDETNNGEWESAFLILLKNHLGGEIDYARARRAEHTARNMIFFSCNSLVDLFAKTVYPWDDVKFVELRAALACQCYFGAEQIINETQN